MAQIPNVSVEFDGDGSTVIFDFDFPYQTQAEIFVSVDGVQVPYVWVGDSTHTVQVTPAPVSGSTVVIYRSTLAYVPKHVFAAGVPFLPRYVDENNRQMLYVAQEAVATANSTFEQTALNTALSREALAAATAAVDTAEGASVVANQASLVSDEAMVLAEAAMDAVEEAGVASYNGRAGIVLPLTGDYSADMVSADGYGDVQAGLDSKVPVADLAAAGGGSLVGFITAGARAVWRSILSKLRDAPPSTMDYAVPADGSTSANIALSAIDLDGIKTVDVLPGDYLISSNLTLNVSLRMREGARFIIPTGVTLTLNGNFQATLDTKFQCTGTGRVVLNQTKTSTGYPEWWGATTNTSVDCTAAIVACVRAVSITDLQAADYYVAGTLQLPQSGRELRGKGCEYYGAAGMGTRIVSLSGETHVLQLGPSVQPASINDFPRGIIVRDLQVTRAVAPVIASAPAGVLNRWTLYSQLINVKSAESTYGFWYQGSVQPRSDACQAFRSIAGTGAGTDSFRGFFVDGSSVLSGVAGGNASCHWSRCVSGCVLPGVTSHGMYINGAWADTFIDDFEASVCSAGITLAGDTTSTLNFRTVDLHITRPIIDQFTFAGIFIDGTGPFGTVSINGGYAAPVGTGTPTACIYANNSNGVVRVGGGFQAICGPSATMTGGIVVINSTNFHSRDSTITETSTRGVIFANSNYCSTDDKIVNYSRVAAAGVSLQGTASRNTVKGALNGAASKVGVGIQLEGASTQFNNIDPSGINPAVLTGAKLQINGATVTTTGLTGTNYVSGVMA